MRLLGTTVATDAGAQRRAGDGATGSGNILTAAATDLMPENAANHCPNDCTRNIGAASILNDLFLLDPAAALSRAKHGADRSDPRLIQSLAVAPVVVVGGNRKGRVTGVIYALSLIHI